MHVHFTYFTPFFVLTKNLLFTESDASVSMKTSVC